MNYYEELGLTQEASAEEIHQAYRGLARLLHPDQQPDVNLKRLAESQMKRLNGIHATLVDPVRRRNYDLTLHERARCFSRIRRSHCVWLLVAFVAGTSLYWLFRDAPPRATALDPVPASVRQAPSVPLDGSQPAASERKHARNQRTSLSAELTEARRQLENALAERDAALAQLKKLRTDKIEDSPPSETDLFAAVPPVLPPALAPENPQQATESRFAGTWVYVQPKLPQSRKSLYPPEYIEAVIVEEEGVLRGRYRARYRVADRPISPDVVFRFEGKANRDAPTLAWTGPGGARGEVHLKLVSENSMEVNWTAIELGSQMGLAAGTAVLIRRQEP